MCVCECVICKKRNSERAERGGEKERSGKYKIRFLLTKQFLVKGKVGGEVN